MASVIFKLQEQPLRKQ